MNFVLYIVFCIPTIKDPRFLITSSNSYGLSHNLYINDLIQNAPYYSMLLSLLHKKFVKHARWINVVAGKLGEYIQKASLLYAMSVNNDSHPIPFKRGGHECIRSSYVSASMRNDTVGHRTTPCLESQ